VHKQYGTLEVLGETSIQGVKIKGEKKKPKYNITVQ
jgi:hypothetical protein